MKLNQIVPMLPISNLAASIEFYEKLGFEVEAQDDELQWAYLSFSESSLMIDQSINQHPDSRRQSVLYLYPEKIEEFHREVRAAGIEIPDLDVRFYGMTEFRLQDPDGNRLWIGQASQTAE